MSFACRSFDLLFLLCVFATYCQYNVHEACQLMDMYICIYIYICVNTECNAIVSFHVSFCLTLIFIWLLTASSVFFPPSSFLSLSIICVLFSLFTTPTHPPFPTVFGASFPSFPPTSPSTCPGAGIRKLVDCPQLLDVDDMVKMREPDWKCVYTYLQEFYRGLVTKGLVKTKNSS